MDPETTITLLIGSVVGIAIGLAYARRRAPGGPLMKRIGRITDLVFRGLAIGFGLLFASGFSYQILTGSELNPSFAIFAVILLLYGAGTDRWFGDSPNGKGKH